MLFCMAKILIVPTTLILILYSRGCGKVEYISPLEKANNLYIIWVWPGNPRQSSEILKLLFYTKESIIT